MTQDYKVGDEVEIVLRGKVTSTEDCLIVDGFGFGSLMMNQLQAKVRVIKSRPESMPTGAVVRHKSAEEAFATLTVLPNFKLFDHLAQRVLDMTQEWFDQYMTTEFYQRLA